LPAGANRDPKVPTLAEDQGFAVIVALYKTKNVKQSH